MTEPIISRIVDGKLERVGNMRHGQYYRLRKGKPRVDYTSVSQGRHLVRPTINDHEQVEARRRAIVEFLGGHVGEPTFEQCNALVEKFGEMNLAEIGLVFGVSRERIRQIEVLALRKLQRNQEYRAEARP